MDLVQLERALAAFAVLDPAQLPLHHVQVFLAVAQRGRATYRELEEALGLSNASISRTVNALAEVHRTGRQGFELLTVHRDPSEGRRYVVSLSARGQALRRQLEQL